MTGTLNLSLPDGEMFITVLIGMVYDYEGSARRTMVPIRIISEAAASGGPLFRLGTLKKGPHYVDDAYTIETKWQEVVAT